MLIRWKSKEKSASSASGGNSKKKRKGRDGGNRRWGATCFRTDGGRVANCTASSAPETEQRKEEIKD